MSTIQNSIRNALSAAGLHFTGGRWLRLKGKDLDSISINSESGGFRDHRTGAHGSFRALGDYLGIPLGGAAVALDKFGTQSQSVATDSAKSIQLARTQWARAIPALPPKRPHGWAQAAWDREQSRYQDFRDTLYDYLVSRGLDPLPLLPLIRIQPVLGSRGIDREMLDQGADYCFFLPMYRLGAPETPEHICGIQRTYLAHGVDRYTPVRKVGRAMLGRKGVTTLPATGSPVTLPETGPVLGAGEGFETVASWVQFMRRPGVVTWDWSGLKAWSETITPGPHAPTIAMLVDNDASETGQRESAAAVRRIRRHEHGKAVYLLPPASIAPDTKGNRDWNDLLVQSPQTFAAEIIHAWYKSDEDMALAPVAAGDEVPVIRSGPRDAETAQAIAEAVALHVARPAVKNAINEHVTAFEKYQEKLIKWENTPLDERKKTKLKKPKLPPLLIKVTTGVGKTHIVRQLIADKGTDLPLLVLTKTHELATSYAEAGAFAYHGRSEPTTPPANPQIGYTPEDLADSGANFAAHACLKYKIIQMTTEKNHVPALTACRSCEHGRKFILDHYHENSAPYLAAKDWFLANRLDPKNIPACLWLGHQMAATHARVVVAPNESYSDTLAHLATPEGILERLVIVDEIPSLTRHIEASSADMGVHAAKCLDLIDIFSRRPHSQDPEAQEEQDKILADTKQALDLFRRVGAWLGESVAEQGIQRIPDALAETIRALHVDWLPGATARWEKAELRYGHEPFVPLRMMRGLIDSIATGTAIVEMGKIHLHEVTALGDRIRKGLPTILLDATPSPAVEYLVQQSGGQVVSAIAKQHVRITHYNQYLHGRTYKNKDHQQAELESLLALRAEMQSETGTDPVVLTHRPLCALAEKTQDGDWGYYGRDDVGQDNWGGRNMLIHGGPILSPQAQALAYNSELMLRRLAGDTESPDWSADVEWGLDVTVGDKVVTSKAPLPSDPRLRDWVLADYGRRIVQGIGRARAVNAAEDKPISVWIAGGLPLAGLAAHGLVVSEYRQERKNRNAESRQKTDEKVLAAMASLQAADRDTAYRAVNEELERMGLPGVRYAAWKRIKDSVYGPDIGIYEGVDTLLAALRQTADCAAWSGEDVSDTALAWWQNPLTDPIARAAAEIVLESSPCSGSWRAKRRTDSPPD